MSPSEWAEILKILGDLVIAFIAGVGGFFVSRQLSKSTIKKTDSEAKKQETDAAKELTDTVLLLMKPLRGGMPTSPIEARAKAPMVIGICFPIPSSSLTFSQCVLV